MAQELTHALLIEILTKKAQSLADLVLTGNSEIERLTQLVELYENERREGALSPFDLILTEPPCEAATLLT